MMRGDGSASSRWCCRPASRMELQLNSCVRVWCGWYGFPVRWQKRKEKMHFLFYPDRQGSINFPLMNGMYTDISKRINSNKHITKIIKIIIIKKTTAAHTHAHWPVAICCRLHLILLFLFLFESINCDRPIRPCNHPRFSSQGRRCWKPNIVPLLISIEKKIK